MVLEGFDFIKWLVPSLDDVPMTCSATLDLSPPKTHKLHLQHHNIITKPSQDEACQHLHGQDRLQHRYYGFRRCDLCTYF